MSPRKDLQRHLNANVVAITFIDGNNVYNYYSGGAKLVVLVHTFLINKSKRLRVCEM